MTSFTYSSIVFSQDSYIDFKQLSELKNFFNDTRVSTFNVTCRSWIDYVKELNIKFIVYDSKFEKSLLSSRQLQLIYFDDNYIICKVKDSGAGE